MGEGLSTLRPDSFECKVASTHPRWKEVAIHALRHPLVTKFRKTSLESRLFYLVWEDCYPKALHSHLHDECISVPLLNHLCVKTSKTVLKDKNWLRYQTAWQITPNSVPYFLPCFLVGSKTPWGREIRPHVDVQKRAGATVHQEVQRR